MTLTSYMCDTEDTEEEDVLENIRDQKGEHVNKSQPQGVLSFIRIPHDFQEEVGLWERTG